MRDRQFCERLYQIKQKYGYHGTNYQESKKYIGYDNDVNPYHTPMINKDKDSCCYQLKTQLEEKYINRSKDRKIG